MYSPLLAFFLCFIVLLQSCCSHARVCGKTLLHEFPIFYSHTEWNLLSSCTNTLLWWRACYQITKLQTNKFHIRGWIRTDLSWVTDVSDCHWLTWLDTTKWLESGQDFFFSCLLYYFFPYSFSSSYFLPLFHCLISILLFPCASVWENSSSMLHEFPIFYSHTESLRAPIIFCGDLPDIKQLNYKKNHSTPSPWILTINL